MSVHLYKSYEDNVTDFVSYKILTALGAITILWWTYSQACAGAYGVDGAWVALAWQCVLDLAMRFLVCLMLMLVFK